MFLGYLIYEFPIVAALSLLCYLPVCLYYKIKRIKRPFIRHLTVYTLLGVVWSILFLTIFWGGLPGRFPAEYRLLNLKPFIWIREPYGMGVRKMTEQLLMNIMMFVPMGIFLPSVFAHLRKWKRTVPVIGLFVFCVETVQYFIGRSADIDDLIMNTVGGCIGYGVYRLLDHCFREQSWWRNALSLEE